MVQHIYLFCTFLIIICYLATANCTVIFMKDGNVYMDGKYQAINQMTGGPVKLTINEDLSVFGIQRMYDWKILSRQDQAKLKREMLTYETYAFIRDTIKRLSRDQEKQLMQYEKENKIAYLVDDDNYWSSLSKRIEDMNNDISNRIKNFSNDIANNKLNLGKTIQNGNQNLNKANSNSKKNSGNDIANSDQKSGNIIKTSEPKSIQPTRISDTSNRSTYVEPWDRCKIYEN